MDNLSKEFQLLLGHAAFKLWPDLPRDVQEILFETAAPNNPLLRYSFAVFLHDHHPRSCISTEDRREQQSQTVFPAHRAVGPAKA
jgi:hypothetical protein